MVNQELDISPAATDDRDDVVALWERCGLVVPHNPPHHDFDFARSGPGSDVLVGRVDDRLAASVMVGHDGHRGWVYYLAVDPACQRQGYGERLVRAAEDWLRERGVRKMQLMVRDTNLGVLEFYRKIGYVQSPVVVMQRWLDHDSKS